MTYKNALVKTNERTCTNEWNSGAGHSYDFRLDGKVGGRSFSETPAIRLLYLDSRVRNDGMRYDLTVLF